MGKKGEKQIPFLYLYLCERIRKKSKVGVVEVKTLFFWFSRFYSIEKRFHYPLLKELKDFNLIEKISNKELKLTQNGFDLTNTSEIYKRAGLF